MGGSNFEVQSSVGMYGVSSESLEFFSLFFFLRDAVRCCA